MKKFTVFLRSNDEWVNGGIFVASTRLEAASMFAITVDDEDSTIAFRHAQGHPLISFYDVVNGSDGSRSEIAVKATTMADHYPNRKFQ